MSDFRPAPRLKTAPCSGQRASLRRVAVGLAFTLSLAGCSTVANMMPDLTPNFSWVYKIDIQQGAVLTQEMVAELKPGMTRDQVRFVLGTPPLTDIFHTDRWDYPYTMQRRSGQIERRNFTVLFEENRVKSFGGDPLPSDKDFHQMVGSASTWQGSSTTDPTLWERVKGIFGSGN